MPYFQMHLVAERFGFFFWGGGGGGGGGEIGGID
jgi:hypothetical protein